MRSAYYQDYGATILDKTYLISFALVTLFIGLVLERLVRKNTLRADDADGAHDPGSHAVLLITEYMLDAGAHPRARRIGGLLRLTEFAIAIGPAMNAAL